MFAGRKLLLVEDEAIIAMAEAHMLRDAGYGVEVAHSGEKALVLYGSDPEISLVLMDIDLGMGLSGPETAERMITARDVPVVFLTSHSERVTVDKVRNITRYGYVIKNSGNFVLLSSIEMAFELFEAHKSQRETVRLLRSVMECHPDVIIFALDTQYRYLGFNERHRAVMRTIWGKEIKEGMNMLDDVIGSHADRIKAKAGFDRALAGDSFVAYEEYGDERLSRSYWQDFWSPIRAADGAILGLTCIVLNIDDLKRMEARVETLEAESNLRERVES